MQEKNRVVSFREELNRINVFPVNDSDTGNNLSATLSGARGNSGIIFAQFINGMAEELSGKGFEGDNFPEVVNKAVPYAYKAVSKPAEGTILGSSVSTLTYYVVGLFK